MDILILSVLLLVELVVIVFLVYQFDKERNRFITAILSKSAPEYAMSMEKLKTSPKDRLKQMKAENDLAIANEKLLNQADERGIPIT